MKIAIIGAGISGLTLAHRFKDKFEVTIFEKSKGVGGRVATRRAGDFAFDHGAQFFKIRTSRFKAFMQPLIDNEIIMPWCGKFAEITKNKVTKTRIWSNDNPHYVGLSANNGIGKYLAEDLKVIRSCKITHIKDRFLIDNSGTQFGPYDWIFLTCPLPQVTALLFDKPVQFLAETKTISACYSLMLGFDEPVVLDFDMALVKKQDISWISVNSSKPGRETKQSILVHSTNAWANQHLEDNQDDVMQHLLKATSDTLSYDCTKADFTGLHRWRYANASRQEGQLFYIDYKKRIAICGDGFIKGRVESAFISADSLANDFLTQGKKK